jgi:hypothetical protein
MLGAALGAILGLAGGLARGSVRAGLGAAAAGALAGLAVAGAVSAVAVLLFFRFHDPEFGGLVVPALVHGVLFASIGGACGLALGLGLGGRREIAPAVLGGMVGGLVGAVLFEVILAVLFPLLRMDMPIPMERLARLAMHLSGAVLIAAVAAWSVTSRTPAGTKPTGPTG